MKDKNIFFDTNLLVYAFLSNDPAKHDAVLKLIEQYSSDNIIISTQVINEVYSALSKNKIDHLYIKRYINDLKNLFNIAVVDLAVIDKCFAVKEKYGFSYWDSLVIASALSRGCSILYSEDMQHQQIIDRKLKIINPFKV